jgi:hypothetical protein
MKPMKIAKIVDGYIRIKKGSNNQLCCSNEDTTVLEFALGILTTSGFTGWTYAYDDSTKFTEDCFIENDTPSNERVSIPFNFYRLVTAPFNRETEVQSPYHARFISEFEDGATIFYVSEESKSARFPMNFVHEKLNKGKICLK